MPAQGMLADLIQGECRELPFPRFNFINQTANVLRANTDQVLKFTTHGPWWVAGINAQLFSSNPGDPNGLISGTNIRINIFDPTLSQFWWTGGSTNENIGLDLDLVAGVAGNQAFMTPARYVAAGTQLVLYASHASAFTPTANSFLTVVLTCFLGDVNQL